jgi:hypothetical protein
MEIRQQRLRVRGTSAERSAVERALELAMTELRAAIAMVATDPALRVLVCGMAAEPRIVGALDELATRSGVVLERRIRPGGGLDVVVRAR